MVSHGDDVRIRATTQGTNGAALYLDFIVPTCALYLEFNLPFSRPSDTDIQSLEMPVALRIDSSDVISLTSTLNPVAMGDSRYILTLSSIQDFDEFTSQMRAGQILRIREGLPGQQPFYYSFSLLGFSQSFDRAKSSCARIAGHAPSPLIPRAKALPPRRDPGESPSDTSKWF